MPLICIFSSIPNTPPFNNSLVNSNKSVFVTNPFLSFTVDTTKPLFTVNDGTTDIGGSEMTAMDIQKLKKAYGCDGNCGAWQKSETGGEQ